VFPSYNAEELCTATFVNVGIRVAVQRRCKQYMNTDNGLWDITFVSSNRASVIE
jgi:hypothetical protein